MSARTKGNAIERLAQDHLEFEGWHVERAWPDRRPIGPGRWLSFSHDFFGVADLVALGRDHALLVQVCTDHGSAAAERRRKMITWREPLGDMPYLRIQLWRWRAGRKTERDRLPRQVFLVQELLRFGERMWVWSVDSVVAPYRPLHTGRVP